MSDIAVFLDQDGTLIDDTHILPTVIEGLRLLKLKSIKLIVVTNQPGIARGELTSQEVSSTQSWLNRALKKHAATIDAFYVCPHVNDDHCVCRKPKAGLITQAVTEWKIDVTHSFIIGDFSWDILAGKQAGLRTILVKNANRAEEELESIIRDCQPDYVCDTLLAAAQKIILTLSL